MNVMNSTLIRHSKVFDHFVNSNHVDCLSTRAELRDVKKYSIKFLIYEFGHCETQQLLTLLWFLPSLSIGIQDTSNKVNM